MPPRIPAALIALLACGLVAPAASAATAEEVLTTIEQNIAPDELADPGSAVRAKAIGELLATDLGLPPAEVLELRLALAESWLDALDPAKAEAEVALVLAAQATPPQRERAGLAWVAAWQLRVKQAAEPAALPSPIAGVEALGDLGPRVAARARTAEAQRLLLSVDKDGKPTQPAEALRRYDEALELLKEQPPAERVPVYHLRLLAMEISGSNAEAVQAWLLERQGDPAAAEVAEAALTSGQKLVGQPAPALKLKRVDGEPGEIDLAASAGKVVVIDFFASWSKSCAAQAVALADWAQRHRDRVVVIGVSLDTKDTIAGIPAYIAAAGITYPLAGDLLGWDSDIDDAWHVDKIPTLVLVDRAGRVRATELAGATVEATVANLDAALQAALGKAPAAPAEGEPP